MHAGGLLSTQEARVARGDSYASFVLSNLPRASITPWLHAARLPFLNFSRTISITKQRRFVSKQGHRQPHIHSKARVLSPQL